MSPILLPFLPNFEIAVHVRDYADPGWLVYPWTQGQSSWFVKKLIGQLRGLSLPEIAGLVQLVLMFRPGARLGFGAVPFFVQVEQSWLPEVSCGGVSVRLTGGAGQILRRVDSSV